MGRRKSTVLSIDKTGPAPIYHQLKVFLKERIHSGEYQPGDQVPTEFELCRRFGISRTPVRQALAELEQEQLIVRRHGSGTYVADYFQASLAANGSGTIGVVLPDLTVYFFHQIARVIEANVFCRGYSMILCNGENRLDKTLEYLRALRARQVQGVILVPLQGEPYERRNLQLIQQLEADGTLFLLLDRYLDQTPTDYVCADNVQGGYLATRHLLALGHRRIGVLSLPECSSVRDRLVGYRQALAEAGLRYQPHLVAQVRLFDPASVHAAVDRLMGWRHRPTALFALNDTVARWALEALAGRKLRVPRDVALMGFDDSEFASLLDVPLTTVEQPLEHIGVRAAEVLLDKIEGKARRPVRELIPVRLVVRRSCGAGRQGQEQPTSALPVPGT